MIAKDKISSIEKRVLQWIKGHPFPQGFDAWCELPETVPDSQGLNKHPTFKETETQDDRRGNWKAIAESFISSATEEGKHWAYLHLDPSGNYSKYEFHLRFPEENEYSPLTPQNTHIWKLAISGIFKTVECINLRVKVCHLNSSIDKHHIRLVNCIIGELLIQEVTEIRGGRPRLELHDCLIGSLTLPPKSLWHLNITGGGIAQIKCPSADSPNPFTGQCRLKEYSFHPPLGKLRCFKALKPIVIYMLI